MRPAACRVVEGLDLHDADDTRHLGRPAQRHRGQPRFIHKIGADGQCAIGHVVRKRLDLGQLRRRNVRRVEIEGRFLGAKMDGNGFPAKVPEEVLRKQMLARMLLHMVVAPRPVDRAANDIAHTEGGGTIQHVEHAVVRRHDIHDRHAAKRSRVVQLPARGRVEAALRQPHGRPPVNVVNRKDRGFKGRKIGIGVVESVAHVQAISVVARVRIG